MLKALLLFVGMAQFLYSHPENQIILVENIVPSYVASALIQYYDAERQNLAIHTDNEFSLSSISSPHIRQILFDLSNRILELMKEHYPLMNRNCHLDHCGLYSRIVGNSCPYHADNVYFHCPAHGNNQHQLRTTCKGDCPGAKFVPNHTPWREYTALIYLNDDFQGGEIAFEDGPCNRLYRKVIPIQARMLVLAPNGSNFFHEVLPIRQGKRYHIAFWYTSDPNH